MAHPSVLHVVESLRQTAGSIAVCVDGLVRALQDVGTDSRAIDNEIELERYAGEVDVVHLHGWGSGIARSAARLARMARKPYVLSPLGKLTPSRRNRTHFVERLVNYFRDRSFVRSAAVVTTINHEDDRRLRSANIHHDIRMVPYGISHSDYVAESASLTEKRRERVLLMLGPIDSPSGCIPLLKAFAELGVDADGWRLALVGPDSGDWRKMLQAAVHRKGGDDRIYFEDADDLVRQRYWLARASLVVAPSLHVRPGVSIMQAVASGVPALTTAFSTLPGLEADVTMVGLSRAELREGLRSAMTMSDHWRREQAQKALAAARSAFDWSVLVDEYLKLYRSIA